MPQWLNNAGSGAATGAAIGGPWGAVIGGAAGILGGLVGGKDAKADQRKIDEEKARALGQSNRFTDYAYDRLGTTDQRGDSAYNEGYGAYSNLLDPRFADTFFGGGGGEGGSGGGGGGGGGGAAPADPYGGMFGSSEDLAGRYRDFKGIDPEAMKYFREYADTGGVPQQYQDDTIAAATAGNRSNIVNEMARRGSAGGLGGIILDSSMARALREEARANNENATNARLGIGRLQQEGRQYGISGIEGHNTNDAQARLQAMGGEGGVLASILGNKVSMRNTDEQVSASRAASGSANALAQAQMRANLYLAGAGGIQNYWQGDNANSSDLRGNILNNNQMTNQQMSGLLGTSINAPSTAQGVMGGMAQGGAFAAPWMSMFGGGQQQQQQPYQGYRNTGSSSAMGGTFGIS